MPPVKLYRIGEVMRYSGLSRQTVHNYTLLGLITETDRSEGGHRLYSEDAYEMLERNQKLKATMTLKVIQPLTDSKKG